MLYSYDNYSMRINLIIMCFTLSQNHHFMSSNITISKVFCLCYSIPEVKLTMLFCYYAVTFFVYLFAVIAFFQEVDDYDTYIDKYIFCSAGGFKEECEIHRVRAERSTVLSSVIIIIGLFLYTFINIIHLLYIVHVPSVLERIRRFCKFWHYWHLLQSVLLVLPEISALSLCIVYCKFI